MQPSFSVRIERPIVISGFSLLCAAGLRTATAFGSSEVNWQSASLCAVDGDLEPWIGSKGLRFHDKSSKLVLTVIAALVQGNRLDQRHVRDCVGLIVGSDGALSAQDEVIRDAMMSPGLMNPKAYPNRGCNVIAGQASLRFGVRGESSVVSSGYGSGIDALIYATRKLLATHHSSAACLVAAGESLSRPRAWRKQHLSNKGISILAEGAVACCLETGPEVTPLGGWRIEGYQQCHTPGPHLDDLYGTFLSDFGLKHTDISIGVEGNCDQSICRMSGVSTVLPFDYFGASLLMAAFDAAIKLKQPEPLSRISLAQLDRSGNTSMVLLQRVEALP